MDARRGPGQDAQAGEAGTLGGVEAPPRAAVLNRLRRDPLRSGGDPVCKKKGVAWTAPSRQRPAVTPQKLAVKVRYQVRGAPGKASTAPVPVLYRPPAVTYSKAL